jgi:hypothetical protein
MKTSKNFKPVNPRFFTIASSIYIALFAVVAAVWLYVYNRYQVLSFMEEGQLFRIDNYYLQGYLSLPGGLTQYASAFFTQFYRYFIVGAILLSVAIASTYWLFWKICRYSCVVERFFILPFIIPVFFLLACSDNLHFRLGNVLGVVVVLSLFWGYLKILSLKDLKVFKHRWIMSIFFYLIAYFIAGGNAVLLVALMLIDELFSKNRSWLYALGMIVLALVIPYLSYRWLYVTSLQTAYLSLTPFDLPQKNIAYYIAWLSIPVIYAWWRGIAFLIIFLPTCYGLKKVTDIETEQVMQMAYEVERANWNKVLELGKQNSTHSAEPAGYFINLALAEKGMLASDMFCYPQTGKSGLFVEWKDRYLSSLYTGELYYRLGMIQEAEHFAFESLVINPTEHGAKAMKRLVYTTMLRRDTPGFEKYIRLLELSPLYRKWAKEQRKHYARYLADSSYTIPNAPRAIAMSDIMATQDTPQTMEAILAENPDNQKAFEYLMTFFLVNQDLKMFFEKMETCYPNMHYTIIPRHLEEALLICGFGMNIQEYILNKYPVRQATIDRFTAHDAAVDAAHSERDWEQLKAEYGDAYFYYFLNTTPLPMRENGNNSIY